MWRYRLALLLGDPLGLHERVVIGEETDSALRRLVAERYYRRGQRLEIRGRWNEALLLLQRGALIDPQYAVLHATVGEVFMRLGRHFEAVSWLERAVELNDEQAAWRVSLAQAFERTGRLDDALRQYHAGLRLAPNLEEARSGAARLERALEERTLAATTQPWWLARGGVS